MRENIIAEENRSTWWEMKGRVPNWREKRKKKKKKKRGGCDGKSSLPALLFTHSLGLPPLFLWMLVNVLTLEEYTKWLGILIWWILTANGIRLSMIHTYVFTFTASQPHQHPQPPQGRPLPATAKMISLSQSPINWMVNNIKLNGRPQISSNRLIFNSLAHRIHRGRTNYSRSHDGSKQWTLLTTRQNNMRFSTIGVYTSWKVFNDGFFVSVWNWLDSMGTSWIYLLVYCLIYWLGGILKPNWYILSQYLRR